MNDTQKPELDAIAQAMAAGAVLMQNRVIRVLMSHQARDPGLILTLCQAVQALEIEQARKEPA